MKSTLFINTRGPYTTPAAQEALDAALASAAFGVPVGLLFMGDGVFQITDRQHPDPAWFKRTCAQFQSLELYDINAVYVRHEDLLTRGLGPENLAIPCATVGDPQIQALLARYDNLLSF